MELAGGYSVVPADVGAPCLQGLAAGYESPQGHRPQQVVAREGCEHGDRGGGSRPAPEPSRPDRGGSEENRNLGGNVVIVDRALCVDRREQIEHKLGDERDQQRRSEQRERRHGQEQIEQVVRAAVVERNREQPPGVCKGLANDPRG